MTSHENTKGVGESVLAKIREKRVTMRPKLYFTLEALLAGLVSVIILIVSIGIASFLVFTLRVNGHESLLSFGPRGIGTFLLLFPWPLVVLDVLLIIFLETLLRRFKFGYRSPILYVLIALVALAGALGLAVDRGTDLNDRLLNRANHGGLPPPFGELYEHARGPAPHDHGVFRGTITSIGTSTLVMQHDDLDRDTDDSSYIVLFPPQFPLETLSVGEQVYVAGDPIGSTTIRAFGIHALSPSGETTPKPLP